MYKITEVSVIIPTKCLSKFYIPNRFASDDIMGHHFWITNRRKVRFSGSNGKFYYKKYNKINSKKFLTFKNVIYYNLFKNTNLKIVCHFIAQLNSHNFINESS